MTKETKIGLLVGLTFIILFAIILSEKGTPQRDSEMPIFAGAGVPAVARGADPSRAVQPFDGAGMVAVDDRLSPIVSTGQTPVQETPVMTEEPTEIDALAPDNLPALPTNIIPIFEEPEVVVGGDTAADGPDEEPLAITSLDTRGAAAPIEGPARPIEDPGLRSALAMGPTLPANPGSTGRIPVPVSESAPREAQPVIPPANRPVVGLDVPPSRPASAVGEKSVIVLAMHKVRPGESLGKIAAQHYGRSTPARIKAIFEANRDQLKDIHRVKPQQTLRIPKIEELAPGAFEPAMTSVSNAVVHEMGVSSLGMVVIPRPMVNAGDRRAAVAPSMAPVERRRNTETARPAVAGFRWYEVQPKDTLSGIARRELGDQRRFMDIYQLNQDRMDNMNTLKPGSKIRLPAKAGEAATPHAGASSFAMDESQ